jgi:hypothetical protein
MNETDHPSLGNAVDGFVFHKQDFPLKSKVEQQAFEVACIDLISKLENLVAKANGLAKDDFVDESSDIGRKILERLSTFANEFLDGKAAVQAKEEIDRATTICYTYDEVLKTRSLAKAILRTFWKIEESDEIKESHAQLGEALTRCCATTFYHAVVRIGNNSEAGKLIDQSTLVFVKELQTAWNNQDVK